jgi:hypothetical protein
MTRITSGLAWLATEAVAVGEVVVLMDMGSFQKKRKTGARCQAQKRCPFQGSALS